ncbi:MAG: hypothetical protein ACPG5B_15295 [Chitinophagales bacterium]
MSNTIIKNSLIFFLLAVCFCSCSNNGDLKIGSLHIATSTNNKAANDMCDCLRPISEVIDKGKSQKDKDFADYLEIIGDGIGQTGHLLECMEEFQKKYEKHEDDEEWEKELENSIRKKCPKVFERFEKLGIDIDDEK